MWASCKFNCCSRI